MSSKFFFDNTTAGSCTGSTRSTWGRASPSWSPVARLPRSLLAKQVAEISVRPDYLRDSESDR